VTTNVNERRDRCETAPVRKVLDRPVLFYDDL